MRFSEFSCELRPSPLGGIGVFATHEMPVGTRVFDQRVNGRIMNLEDVPSPLRRFCIYVNDFVAICPERFDRLELGWFINHSHEPNIQADRLPSPSDSEDPQKLLLFLQSRKHYAVKDIKAGDEIFIDYNTLGEPDFVKEDYFIK